MIAKGGIENPFIVYNIRLASTYTALQHAILAVAACHRAYFQPDIAFQSRNHYAIALRGVKFGITEWATCGISERVALLATCLTLCWYEVNILLGRQQLS